MLKKYYRSEVRSENESKKEKKKTKKMQFKRAWLPIILEKQPKKDSERMKVLVHFEYSQNQRMLSTLL